MPEGISSALSSAGNWASSLPSSVMNWLSPTAQAASAADSAAAAGYTTPGIYSPIDATTGAAAGIPSGAPPGLPPPTAAGAPTGDWFSGTPAAAPDSLGGGMAGPAGMPYITASTLPGTMPPTSVVPADGTSGPAALAAGAPGAPGAPTTAVAGTPSIYGTAQDPNMPAADSKPWYAQVIEALTGKELGKGGGGAMLGTAGNLAEAIQRWQMQRRLQDPSQVLAQSQKLAGGLSKGLKRDIGAATGQEMAAAGLAGAPGLYSQAVASALAPYRYQQQQDALREYLAAMQESMGAYPGTGGQYGPYGGYGSYPGEEQQQQQATPA